MTRPPRTRGLGRSFRLLFTGKSASALGTAASVIALPVIALPVIALRPTGDVRQAGLTGAALSLGILLARLPAGAIADRCARRDRGTPRSPMNPRSTA
ncbi:hypothetical protein ACFTXM_45350 [Streptomyces sp. NPDC056930]|uniref:hypothetical protein n=1 Tax=Streptomyces sp. NPDC056930 TaxID=3345967 RepID=UPI0036313950